jgi:plasmid stability protein
MHAKRKKTHALRVCEGKGFAMPALQVRDLPQDIYDDLKAQAEREHRSLSQQTVVLLQAALRDGDAALHAAAPAGERKVSYQDALAGWQYPPDETNAERIARRKRLLARFEEVPPIQLPADFPTSEEIVREMRDAR